MRNAVDFLTGNLIINLAFLAWAVAQVLKLLVTLISERRWDWQHILSSGGMPSSHSACVCSCAAAVGYLYGLDSALFAIAAVLAAVVMYDAFNVRQETGKQARILNYMMEHWSQMKPEEIFDRALKELIGHTPLQVLMGALLGIAMGWGGAYFLS
ncbi:MAG: divergent PAP2 family protein [Oscillospiraceae bacterium]|jgi:acid phosphatase family membrane protein YuiD|nr:divergent PAP2 family protein [Oscillospiraceae bacterium]